MCSSDLMDTLLCDSGRSALMESASLSTEVRRQVALLSEVAGMIDLLKQTVTATPCLIQRLHVELEAAQSERSALDRRDSSPPVFDLTRADSAEDNELEHSYAALDAGADPEAVLLPISSSCMLPTLPMVEHCTDSSPGTPTSPSKPCSYSPTFVQAEGGTESAAVGPESGVGQSGGAASQEPGDLSDLVVVCGKPDFKWTCGEQIGSGGFGTIFKALDDKTGRMFVVKTAKLEHKQDTDRKSAEALSEELGICKDLRHRNIVSYLGHGHIDGNLHIFLEYVAGGSLARLLQNHGPLQDALLRKASRGLLQGLNYLHTRPVPVVHRDVKGANVLVGLDFCMKLADFGCSKSDVATQSLSIVGSIPWMAPEVLQQCGHGRKADIWSYGCTVLEMATAESNPWCRKFDNLMSAWKHIAMSDAMPPIPADLCDDAQEFIASCIRRKSDERLGSHDLLEFRFVSEVDH